MNDYIKNLEEAYDQLLLKVADLESDIEFHKNRVRKAGMYTYECFTNKLIAEPILRIHGSFSVKRQISHIVSSDLKIHELFIRCAKIYNCGVVSQVVWYINLKKVNNTELLFKIISCSHKKLIGRTIDLTPPKKQL